MEANPSSLAFLAFFFVFSSATGALDVTKTLKPFPELKTFNELLTKTQLVGQINKLNAVTLLAFDNDAAASIVGKPMDVVKKIVSNHVVLEYLDLQRLTERLMQSKSVKLTTMFQSSGLAKNNAGFLNASLVDEGENVFGSGVKGSPLNAKLKNETVTMPYTISVFEITEPIIAPGIEESSSTSSSDAKAPSSSDAKAPSSSANSKAASSPAAASAESLKEESSPAGEPSGEEAEAPAAESAASSATQGFSIGIVAVFISAMLAL